MAKLKRYIASTQTWEYIDPSVMASTPGPQGIPGPQGPPGTGSGSPTSFLHTQTISSSTWTIVHGLNRAPAITVYEAIGNSKILVTCEVVYVDQNTIQLEFSTPIAGEAYLT